MSSKFIVPLFAALFLRGCNGVSLSTLWKMRKLDLARIDPAQVRIVLRSPDWMTPMLEDIHLFIKADIWGKESNAYIFRMKKVLRSDDTSAIMSAGLDPTNLSILEIDASERRSLGEALENIGAFKKAGYQLGISVGLWNRDLSGCTNFRPPEGPVIMDVYLHLDDASGWVPLFEKRDFSGEIGKIEQNGMNCDNDVKSSAAKTKAAPMVGAVKSHTKELHGGVSVQSEK